MGPLRETPQRIRQNKTFTRGWHRGIPRSFITIQREASTDTFESRDSRTSTASRDNSDYLDISNESTRSGSKLNAALTAAVKSRRSSVIQGPRAINIREVEAAVQQDRLLKKSMSDYIYVPTKPPATIDL